MSGDAELTVLSQRVGAALQQAGIVLVTAESCTGGWIAEVVTQIAGSSAWFDSGFVTYSNTAKVKLLGVSPRTLVRHGAVSEATAAAMVSGALAKGGAGVALSVTGIAGPGGGTEEKPVGTVCFGWALSGQEPVTQTCHFAGDRASVRRQSVFFALEGLLKLLAAG